MLNNKDEVMITFGYKSKYGGIVRGSIALLMGIVMLFVGNAVNLIIYILATSLLIFGLFSLYVGLRKEISTQRPLVIINTGLNIVIAMLMYIFAPELGKFVVGVIGFMMLLFGLLQLVVMISASRSSVISKGFLVAPIFVLLLGGFLLFQPDFIGRFLGVLVGIAFMFYGASEIISSWKVRSVINQANQQPSQSVDEQVINDRVRDVEYERVDEQ